MTATDTSGAQGTPFDRARARLELGFAHWGTFCHDRAWWVILVTALIVGWISTDLPSLRVDTSNESYLREDDPARVTYHEFQREFGKDERIVVLVESDADILNEDFLRRLQTLHQALEQIPQVNKVDSLVNARLTLADEDTLVVRELLELWPGSEAEWAELRRQVLGNPVYREHFISTDLTRSVLLVTPNTYSARMDGERADAERAFISDAEIYSIVDRVGEIQAEFNRDDFRISRTGPPFIMHQLTFVMARDMFVFSAAGVVLISVLLFSVFRRWVMVVLPLLVAALSVYFVFALLAFSGRVATTSVQILPSLLLAVGVGNSVHICSVYFQALDRGRNKRDALRHALGHSGLAVMMTGLTTAGGLASFITANMKPIADIGIVAPLGILSALVFSLSLLPALLAVARYSTTPRPDPSTGRFHRFLMWCADTATFHPGKTAGAWAVLLGLCLIQAASLRPSHNPIAWFPEGSEVRAATETMDRHFGGATTAEIVIDSRERNGLHDPQLLHAVDRALTFAREFRYDEIQAGAATSLLAVNKELHQALNGGDPAYYAIPDNRQLIAQELLLLEISGSDTLDDMVDSDFRKMRVTVNMPFVDGIRYGAYLPQLQQGFTEIIGDRADVVFTGVVSFLASSVGFLIGDTIRAYALAFMIIAPLMMLLVGSVRTGLISMIPNIAPIIVTLALMTLLEIPLDAFTLLVGSIALGLAVDDTIHFMHNYRRYYAESGNVNQAVRQTLETTGRALLITSLVLSAAFFTNLLGSMHNLQAFGLLTGVCILVAFLADVLLAPALMALLARFRGTVV